MAHKNTIEGGHDLTASAFIVRRRPKPSLALHEHPELGQQLQFGGHVEPNETPWATALRKAESEGGFTTDQLEVWQPTISMYELNGATLQPIPFAPNTHPIPLPDRTHYHDDSPFAFTVLDDGE